LTTLQGQHDQEPVDHPVRQPRHVLGLLALPGMGGTQEEVVVRDRDLLIHAMDHRREEGVPNAFGKQADCLGATTREGPRRDVSDVTQLAHCRLDTPAGLVMDVRVAVDHA
jgi:hypothetical protein